VESYQKLVLHKGESVGNMTVSIDGDAYKQAEELLNNISTFNRYEFAHGFISQYSLKHFITTKKQNQ